MDFVVGKRVRVRADDLRVHQRRPLPRPSVVGRLVQHVERCHHIAAIHFLNERPGKPVSSLEMMPPGVFTSTGTEMA